MIRMLTCTNCKETTNLIFELTWTYKEKYCKKCDNTEYSKQKYYFCSYKCMNEWVNKAKNCIELNIHEWTLDNPKTSASDYSPIKNGKITVSEHCQICDMQRFVKH